MAERLIIIDGDLRDALSDVTYAKNEFEAAKTHSDGLAGAVGHAGLASACRDFADGWRIHREKLQQALETVEAQLKGAIDTFEKADSELAKAAGPQATSTSSGGGGGSGGAHSGGGAGGNGGGGGGGGGGGAGGNGGGGGGGGGGGASGQPSMPQNPDQGHRLELDDPAPSYQSSQDAETIEADVPRRAAQHGIPGARRALGGGSRGLEHDDACRAGHRSGGDRHLRCCPAHLAGEVAGHGSCSTPGGHRSGADGAQRGDPDLRAGAGDPGHRWGADRYAGTRAGQRAHEWRGPWAARGDGRVDRRGISRFGNR
ncbi:MAG: hypothetical protein IPL94_09565 [Tetrasphaera sp.]|nr:hypothetical protein [Tetrasphaera sp.]